MNGQENYLRMSIQKTSRAGELLLFFLLAYTTASNSQTRYLIPYREGELWGYADTNLHVVVIPRYDRVHFFSQGFALVKKGGKYGLLNTKGKEILPIVYDEINGCCEHMIAVREGYSGFIHLPSRKIILPLCTNSFILQLIVGFKLQAGTI